MIHLASYKSTQKGWQGIFNRGIRWLTKSQYSHTEICVGNPFEAPVPCISSSGSDGGVRSKIMQLSPEKWDILPMPQVTEQEVQEFLAQHKNTGYDFVGCGRFLLPFALREHPEKWFCTEVAAAIAGYQEPWRFSPADFHVIALAQVKASTPTTPPPQRSNP